MATVTITLTDTGPDQFETRVESDPPLPIRRVTDPKWLAELGGEDRDLDVDAATPAQVAARLALGELMGSLKTSKLIVRPE